MMIYYEQESSKNQLGLQLFKPIIEPRIYHLAGDILIEPRIPRNEVEKTRNG